ncbi:transmembrane protein [Anaeramoeba flamelloides]|uniref:Transmembrane protein n=1 Tax=Anaeramoeba flamelloides TaxID=1746091 RepID=A0ABQ8YYR1_9EUKA|nr:transmembrane protein [Anaeramoeba flamelloides]
MSNLVNRKKHQKNKKKGKPGNKKPQQKNNNKENNDKEKHEEKDQKDQKNQKNQRQQTDQEKQEQRAKPQSRVWLVVRPLIRVIVIILIYWLYRKFFGNRHGNSQNETILRNSMCKHEWSKEQCDKHIKKVLEIKNKHFHQN